MDSSKYIYHKVRDDITYPTPNFSGATVDVWQWMSSFKSDFSGNVTTYPFGDWS